MKPRERSVLDEERDIEMRRLVSDEVYSGPAIPTQKQSPTDQQPIFQTLTQNFRAQNVPATRDTLNGLAILAEREQIRHAPYMSELDTYGILCALVATDIGDITATVLRFVENAAKWAKEDPSFVDCLVAKGFGLSCLAKLRKSNLRRVHCLTRLARVSATLVHQIARSEFLSVFGTMFGGEWDEDLVALLGALARCDGLDVIEEQRILRISKTLLEDRTKEWLWEKLLVVPRNRISDAGSAVRVLVQNNFLRIANAMMSEKRVNVVVNAVHLIGMYFLHTSEYIEVDYAKLVALTTSSHNSVARVSLWTISNIMISHYPMVHRLVALELIPGLKRVVCEGKLKTKYEALSVMSLMVMGGSVDERRLMVTPAAFVTAFTTMLEISDAKFINVISDPLCALLSLNLQDGWRQFEEASGMDIIDELMSAEDQAVSEYATALKRTIASLRKV